MMWSRCLASAFLSVPRAASVPRHAARSSCSTQSPFCARRRPLKRSAPSGPWRTGCACASRARRPMLDLTAQYLAGLPQAEPVDAVIRECHARTALETLASGETEIGVIRFRSEYRDYFDEQTSARGLSFELLSKYHYLVTMNQSHPLGRAQFRPSHGTRRTARDRPRRCVPRTGQT